MSNDFYDDVPYNPWWDYFGTLGELCSRLILIFLTTKIVGMALINGCIVALTILRELWML